MAQRTLYIHHCAQAHFSRGGRDVLSWPMATAWPPSSPDLNLLMFTCRDAYRTLCMQFLLTSPRSMDACQNIRNCPSIFERMRQPMMRRVEECAESRARCIHLLFQVQVVRFRAHVHMNSLLVCLGATLCQSLSATFSHTLYILLANFNFYMLNLVTCCYRHALEC
jgi:hypothetical protein